MRRRIRWLIYGYDVKKGKGEVKYGQTSKFKLFMLKIAYLDYFNRMIPKMYFWDVLQLYMSKIIALQKIMPSVSPVFFCHRETYRNIPKIRDNDFVERSILHLWSFLEMERGA